jgi:hypothetical protein
MTFVTIKVALPVKPLKVATIWFVPAPKAVASPVESINAMFVFTLVQAPPPAASTSKRNQHLDENLKIQSSLPGGCSTFRAPPAALFNRRLHQGPG